MLYLGYFSLHILKIFNLQYIYNYTCTVLALYWYLAESSTADKTLFVNHAFFIMGIQYGPTCVTKLMLPSLIYQPTRFF